MKIINNELDLRQWFKDNYKEIGFSKIVKENFKGFPDFIVIENGEEKRVEMEVKSSNFNYHKHPIDEVDKVICVMKDEELAVPIIEIENIRLAKFGEGKESEFSIINKIKKLFKKEKILTTSEISKKLGIHWNTAEKYLLELVIEGKIQKIKKEGVNLWLLK